ncbi:hypothetical protein GGD65_003198 [Bradyrhizobium sp. CIR18]|uniref:hypothetical protein n=1 Tax=Bradyrhizobium sp. CIR18 TaxID=2663839 RepID=UPI001606396E|nr:hypothetical protein [Bradyrhizobium sp. CIR18]MBB4362173.1 hypothetical protein [Bradyrhizobium sp. CIR18]
MTVLHLETRLIKLEARTARPDEMLVVWRRPSGEVAEALKGATFAKGDKVICAEWFEEGPVPEPRWYRGRLRSAMGPAKYAQVERTIERVAEGSAASRNKAGFAPYPNFTEDRAKEMTDAELIYAILGVRT